MSDGDVHVAPRQPPWTCPQAARCPADMPPWLREAVEGIYLRLLLERGVEGGPVAMSVPGPAGSNFGAMPLWTMPKEAWRWALKQVVADQGGAQEIAIVFAAWLSAPAPDHPAPPLPKDDPKRRHSVQVVWHRRGAPEATGWYMEYRAEGRALGQPRRFAPVAWHRLSGMYTPHLDGVLGPLRRPAASPFPFIGDGAGADQDPGGFRP